MLKSVGHTDACRRKGFKLKLTVEDATKNKHIKPSCGNYM